MEVAGEVLPTEVATEDNSSKPENEGGSKKDGNDDEDDGTDVRVLTELWAPPVGMCFRDGGSSRGEEPPGTIPLNDTGGAIGVVKLCPILDKPNIAEEVGKPTSSTLALTEIALD